MRSIVAHACPLAVLLCMVGCSGSNPDALVARDGGTSGSAGGGGSIVDAASEATEGPDDAAPEGPMDAPAPEAGGQPDGPSVFTLVHGIVDARHLRACFQARFADAFKPVAGAPIPDEPTGLAFAHALSASTLPGGVDLATTDVRPIVYTGNLDLIAGMTCEQLEPPPGGVRATALSVIPAGTLTRQRSVLLVMAGCVGGDGHEDSASGLICGPGYASFQPTATLLMASMDRSTTPGRVGIQAFGGSVASSAITADLGIAKPASTLRLASNVGPGVLSPTPPAFDVTSDVQGLTPLDNTLRFREEGQVDPSAEQSLPEALSRGGADALAEGANFTVIWVGPRPGVAAGLWWQDFTPLVVRSAPTSP